MSRLRILLIGFTIASLVVALKASRTATPAGSHVGSISPAAPMLEPRSGHSATLLPDGKVLISGGMRRNQDFYRSAELFDPASGKFQPTGEMSVVRVGHAAVLLNSGKVLRRLALHERDRLKDGRVLLAGGYPNNDRATGETWIYKP